MNLGPVERLIPQLAVMEREDLVWLLKHVRFTFPVDFTDDFLRTVDLDRLRHIVLAVSVHQERACA